MIERVGHSPTQGVSERLRRFVAEAPWERTTILDFVRGAAASMSPGTRVLDIGAGDAPYRELFEHVDYRTVDWASSCHAGARVADITASAETLPCEEGSFDVVLMTQVLEHVADPPRVLAEAHRVLQQGGSILLTVPLTWELHELPHDYYRYTPAGLRHLLCQAGFEEVRVEPRNDCFATVAQLMRNLRWAMGRADDGLDERRDAAAEVLEDLAEAVATLGPLDVAMILPLGYSVVARRPET